jgi:antitoxin VapB
MGIVESKTFKSGNSIAVRLPRDVAFAADIAVTIERNGDVLTIRPVEDLAREKRELMALIAELDAIGPIGEIEQREPIEFSDRAER